MKSDGVIRAIAGAAEIESPLGNSTRRAHRDLAHASQSPLADMLFTGDGKRMKASHAFKKARRSRYYVSRPLSTKCPIEHPVGLRTPPEEIEQPVTSGMRRWLVDPPVASIRQRGFPIISAASADR